MSKKPLGHRAYGSIPHLPGSRRGAGDHGLSVEQGAILTDRCREGDLITVQEKLDGSCVAVWREGDEVVPLIRAGYRAECSHYEMHHRFGVWAMDRRRIFLDLLDDGERVVGEWLDQAHGTRYDLFHEPFVAFDIMRGHVRCQANEVHLRCDRLGIETPFILHVGNSISTDAVMRMIKDGSHGHGALDPVEGAVWRCEHRGNVEFLGKFVRPDKVDGLYLKDGAVVMNSLRIPQGGSVKALSIRRPIFRLGMKSY